MSKKENLEVGDIIQCNDFPFCLSWHPKGIYTYSWAVKERALHGSKNVDVSLGGVDYTRATAKWIVIGKHCYGGRKGNLEYYSGYTDIIVQRLGKDGVLLPEKVNFCNDYSGVEHYIASVKIVNKLGKLFKEYQANEFTRFLKEEVKSIG